MQVAIRDTSTDRRKHGNRSAKALKRIDEQLLSTQHTMYAKRQNQIPSKRLSRLYSVLSSYAESTPYTVP